MAEIDIRRTLGSIDRHSERTIKRVGFGISSELVKSTPVDLGWARANWIISIGKPVDEAQGTRENVSAAAQAQAAGQGRLLVWKIEQGDIWISNNVPYIEALNAGHSKQAPAGFVEDAIDRGIRAIR